MDQNEATTVPMEGRLELKHADSNNSMPPPPPPPVPPVATAESDDLLDTPDLEKVDVQLQQAEEEKIVVKEDKEVRSDNCCDRVLRCLSYVPCGSLVAWIIMLLGLGGLAGGLVVGTRKARDLLNNDMLLWFIEYTVTGIIVSMFVLGTCFLVAGHLSTDPTSRRVFNSSSKNRCGRGLNMFLLGFLYVLCLCWVLACMLLTTPVVLLGLMYIVTDKETCFNPKNYGEHVLSRVILPTCVVLPIPVDIGTVTPLGGFLQKAESCGADLEIFKNHAKDVLICYSVSLLSAVIIVVSMIHFLICVSANITHLRDNRFATLNAYEGEELRNSKHSVLDTNM